MFLNEKEEKIISIFYKNLDEYAAKYMTLIWRGGKTIIARFDTCFEDENDFEEYDSGYEEFTTFVFEAVSVSGNPPVFITEDNFFCINYQNFPDEILVDNKKIN